MVRPFERRPVSALLAFVACALLVVGLTPLASRVSAQDLEPGGTVRFVHALAGGGPVDVLIDGEARVQGIEFGTATEYASFPEGEVEIQVVPAGATADQALTDETIDIDSGDAYNVVIGNQEDDLEARVYEVNLDAIDAGRARVRVLHSSPDAGDLDIELRPESGLVNEDDDDDAVTFDGLGYLDEPDYDTIPAGSYIMTARIPDETDATLEVAGLALDPGRVYDLLVIGRASDSTLTMLPLITPVSRPCGELLEVGNATDACVRFVHASPDAGAVDVYVDGSRVADGVEFGAATDFLAFPAEDAQVQIVPAGQSTDDAVLDETYGLSASQAYQISVIGSSADDDDGDNDLRLHENEIDLTPLPAGQARIRVTHAGIGVGDVDVLAQGDNELFSDVGFDDATDYAVVDAGIYNIDVRGDDDAILFSVSDLEIQEGIAYDVFAVGRADDNSITLLVLTANATERTGGQGTATPLDPDASNAGTPEADVVEATVVEGTSEAEEQIEEAPVTPITTPEVTETT